MELKRKSIALLTISILFASALGVIASTNMTLANNEPTYGTAVVDGDYSEWDLDADFFANLTSGSGKTWSKLYLRIDCYCGGATLYVLVLNATDPVILVEGGTEVWVKINDNKVVSSDSGDDGVPPDFAWINSDDTYANGWEASVDYPLRNGDWNLKVHCNSLNGLSETQGFDGTLTVACTEEDCCDEPFTRQVIVVIGSTEYPKPPGLFKASWIDTTAAGIAYGMSGTTENGKIGFDRDPSFVNQATGVPDPGLGSTIVTSGGPLVNAVAKYYEGQGIAPAYYAELSGNTIAAWNDTATGEVIPGSELLKTSITTQFDHFIIQKFIIDDDTDVVMIYGFSGHGTLAGAEWYFRNWEALEGREGYWIYSWADNPSTLEGSLAHPDWADEAAGYTELATSGP